MRSLHLCSPKGESLSPAQLARITGSRHSFVCDPRPSPTTCTKSDTQLCVLVDALVTIVKQPSTPCISNVTVVDGVPIYAHSSCFSDTTVMCLVPSIDSLDDFLLKVASWFDIRWPRARSSFAPTLRALISSVFFSLGTNLCSSSFLLPSRSRPWVNWLISCIPEAAVTLRGRELAPDSWSISTVANEGEAEKVEYRFDVRFEVSCAEWLIRVSLLGVIRD